MKLAYIGVCAVLLVLPGVSFAQKITELYCEITHVRDGEKSFARIAFSDDNRTIVMYSDQHYDKVLFGKLHGQPIGKSVITQFTDDIIELCNSFGNNDEYRTCRRINRITGEYLNFANSPQAPFDLRWKGACSKNIPKRAF